MEYKNGIEAGDNKRKPGFIITVDLRLPPEVESRVRLLIAHKVSDLISSKILGTELETLVRNYENNKEKTHV
jgi:hypothetical protein